MASSRQRRFSDINSDSPPAHYKPSRVSGSRRAQEYQTTLAEENSQRNKRHSSSHMGKGSLGGNVHAESRDMPQSFSSPGRQPPRTPQRTCSTPHYVNPSSSLLQDLIREQRAARNSRPPTVSGQDSHENETLGVSSEIPAPEKNRQPIDALPAGVKEPKEMGIREMNQYVGRITREVFDLKLEIVHREKQMKAMKAKLERMAKLEELVQELEATEADLRETNAMLQKDIEKRDQGLQEAVALICDLELKIETMETGKDEAWSTHGISLLSTDNLEEVQTPKSKCMIEVPDRSSSRKGTSSAKKRRSRILPAQHPRRQPSFLLNENESTSVLRSLYTTGANGSRALSIFSGYETEELDSPRLSALSECSDLDAYPDPIKLSEPEPTSTVSRSGPLPPFVTEKTGSEAYGDSKFLQIEDWIPHTPALPDDRIQAPSGNAIKDSQMTAKRQPTLGAAFEAKRTRNLKPEGPRNVSMFGGRLPPTPDTMSTSFKDRSVIEERSHYDRNNVYSSTTSVDYMASAGNVTTRPSTADTALFDGFDSWKQSDLRDDGGSDVECMLPSSYTRYASEPPQASASFSTEEELVAHEKHSLWTNQNHNIDQAHPRFLHSLRSRLSDSALSDLYLNRNASQSTMLSPLDWLEAAEATPDDLDDSPGNLWRSSTAEFAQDGEFQPPLVPTSRTRHNRSDQKYSQVRKGFASRLFGRSKTSTVHGPSSPGKNMPVSPRSVTDKRSSNTRRRSTKLDSNLKSPRRTAPRPISTYSAPEDPSVKNPRNYNSLENIKQPDDHQHRRRGSMSLLGWLKGSSNNNNNNDNIISPLSSSSPSAQKPISPITASPNTHINSGRCASQPPQRPNSSWGFSMRPTSRQSSRLNHNNLAINSSSTESVAALQHNNSHKRIRHPLAEEVQRSGP